MDIESEVAVGQFFDRDGIVKVLGILAVYRDRKKVTEIASSLPDLFVHESGIGIDRQGLDFSQDFIRKVLRQAELP